VLTVQNAAAHLVSEAYHTSPWQLHWLPVKQRVEYKLAVLTYRAVHGLLPLYLQAGDSQLVSTTRRRQLRSSDIPTLVVQRTSTRFGDRCAAARTWNQLHRRWGIQEWDTDSSVGSWRRVNSLSETATHCDFVLCALGYILTYLLTYLIIYLLTVEINVVGVLFHVDDSLRCPASLWKPVNLVLWWLFKTSAQ